VAETPWVPASARWRTRGYSAPGGLQLGQLYFVFSKLFNHPNFKIGIDVLTDVQNSLNFVVR
jgi:hypothetical protein